MIRFVSSFLLDESGASAAEYALILAIIGTGIALSAVALGSAIGTAIEGAATTISSATKSK